MSRFGLSLTFFCCPIILETHTKKLCVIVLFLVCTRFLYLKTLSYQCFQCVKTWHASCLYKGVKQNKENLGDEGKWQKKQLC
ncbi:hypothetical protein D2A77_07400 [Enterococcus faecalis]|nr:hypothetical protein [Enterococcus faecalis]EGO8995881.1 hypothetical protein [Enterococcus faecalis]